MYIVANRPATLLVAIICLLGTVTMADDERRVTQIAAGSSIELLTVWPKIGQAPKAELATIELWLRPDQAAVARPRSFVMTLSNRGGNDRAGLSLTLRGGVIRAAIFGILLDAPSAISTTEWTHVALTVNTQTVNKQARLWINGQLVAEELVLEYWPKTFEVARMLSDKWNQGRVYSGDIGDVRFSSRVRYTAAFTPPPRLEADNDTSLLLSGDGLPLK